MQIENYRRNRARIPFAQLEPHVGRWGAFSSEGSRLIAVADDLEALDRQIREAGDDPERVAIERIAFDDDWTGAAEFE